MLLPLTSCREEKHYRIGISQCSQDDWRSKMNDEIHREIMLHPEAEVEIRSADDSNEKQIADIRYFKENDFDIIIAAPNEADAITPIIKEVYESGIPVIVFDRDINGNTYTANQGVDNYGIGTAAAQYAYSITGDKAKVIEIYGLAGSTPAIQRHNGFVDEAAKLRMDIIDSAHGNWNYICTQRPHGHRRVGDGSKERYGRESHRHRCRSRDRNQSCCRRNHRRHLPIPYRGLQADTHRIGHTRGQAV